MKAKWKPEKNEWLKEHRGLSYEDIEEAIAQGRLVAVLENKNHRNQVILVVQLGDYMIAVAALIRPGIILFMTAYPSTALTKRYEKK